METFNLTIDERNASNFSEHATQVSKAVAMFRSRLAGLRRDESMCDRFGASWKAAQVLAQSIFRTREQQEAAQQRLRELVSRLHKALQVLPSTTAEPAGSTPKRPETLARDVLDLSIRKLYHDAQLPPQLAVFEGDADSPLDLVGKDVAGVTQTWRSLKPVVFAHDATAAAGWESSWQQAAVAAKAADDARAERSRLFDLLASALHHADEIIDTEMRPCVQQQSDLAQRSADRDRRLAATVIIACVVLSLGICLWVSRHIGGGVSQSIAFAEHLASGDLQARWQTERRDEFGSLAVALNQTAGKLAKNEENLRREIMARGRLLEALQESEQRFGQIAENISEIFWMIAADTHEVMYISPAYEAICGFSCASVYAHPGSFMDGVVAEDRPRLAAAIARCEKGEQAEVEYRIVHPGTRQIRWVRSRCFPLLEKHKPIGRLCGVTEDITDRKSVEEGTEELNKRLRELSHQAGMAEVATSVLHNVGNVLNSVNVAIEVAMRTTAHFKVAGLKKAAMLLDEHSGNLTSFLTGDAQGTRLPAFLSKLAQHFKKEQVVLLGELQCSARTSNTSTRSSPCSRATRRPAA